MKKINRLLYFIALKCARSDEEKKHIAHQVVSATKKASKQVQHLKQENSMLTFTIEVTISLIF